MLHTTGAANLKEGLFASKTQLGLTHHKRMVSCTPPLAMSDPLTTLPSLCSLSALDLRSADSQALKWMWPLTKRESRAMLSLTCSRAGKRLLLVEQLTL